MGPSPLRLLTFSTLYPNAVHPNHGVFVENRLRHLLLSGGVSAEVVAPVPWFPSDHAVFGRYALFARVPDYEERHGLAVHHPRFLVIPHVGSAVTPWTLYAGSRAIVRRLFRQGTGIDFLDAHYFYPDGVAAALLARAFGLPLTITARGSDISLFPRYPLARRSILWAARQADALITVCDALKDELVRLGVDAGKIRTLRNGVDLQMFRPLPQQPARDSLGVDGPVLLSVGALIPRKRHDLVIRALPMIENACLLIAGQGPEEPALRALSRAIGVSERVRFLGGVPHAQLAEVYSAADVLVLASSREGWANVLLEAMACGTPVVATRIWGTPEVVRSPAAGRLLDTATPDALADALRHLLADPPPREATRRYAEGFGWTDTSRGQIELFSDILRRRAACQSAPAVLSMTPARH